MKKESKQSISVIQRKIWDLCKKLIRSKYKNVCYTCGRAGLEGSNWHTGHIFPKAALGAYLKYDLRVLRPQCYNCNINLGGNGAVFIENMRLREGNRYVNKLIKDRQISVKASDYYEVLLVNYNDLWHKLEKQVI